MKINLRKILFSFMFVLTIFTLCIISTKNINANSGPGIAISPEYPKEQIQKSGIFNDKFQPNRQYDLTIKLVNTTNNDKTITISPNTAYTSNSGNMEFDKSKIPNDSTRKYDFRSLFTQKEKKINIPGNKVSKVSFRLKMPSKQYQGIIAGGFYINVLNTRNNTSNGNFKINNDFSYGLAAVIHDTRETAQPNLKLNNVNLNNDNNILQVQSNIQNRGAGIVSGMNVDSEVTKVNNNQVITKSNSNNLSMAPNSSFNYNNTINNNLAPGQYKVKLNINDSTGHHWKENKEIRISAQNSASHFIKKVPWKLYIIIGTITILIILIAYLIYHQHKLKNKLNNESNDSNNK